MQRSEAPSNHLFPVWKGIGFAFAFTTLLCGLSFIVTWGYELARHPHVYQSMELAILKLAEKRPANVTDEQWAHCLGCTWNLHVNYGGRSYIPTAELERIIAELDVKISDGTTLATIDWFWDEYMRSAPSACNYERYRPTSPAQLASAPSGGNLLYPLSWWRSEYKRRTGKK